MLCSRRGYPVSSQMLRFKALEVAADEGLSPNVFKASHSWRRRLMRRHKLSIRARTRQGLTTLEHADAAKAKFCGDVRAAIVEHGFTNVYNADQTAVFFEYLPRKTVSTKESKTVWVKCSGKEKERVTVMLFGDWNEKQMRRSSSLRVASHATKTFSKRTTRYGMDLMYAYGRKCLFFKLSMAAVFMATLRHGEKPTFH